MSTLTKILRQILPPTTATLYRVVLLAFGGSIAGGAVAADPVCKALVKSSDNFYLVASDGTQTARFTNDQLGKSYPALSPDASKMAYLLNPSGTSVTVVNQTGQTGQFQFSATSSGSAALRSISWANNTIVQLDRHVSPGTELFEHYQIPDSLTPAAQLTRADLVSTPGEVCALAPTTLYPACVQGGDIYATTQIVYSQPGFDPAPLQSLTIPIGGVGNTVGEPTIQVQVVSVTNGITLKATLPEGPWVQSRLLSGGILPVEIEGVRYGLLPTIVSGGVRVSLLKSISEGRVLDSVIAWRGADGHIVFVETTSAGRALTILRIVSTNPQVWTVHARALLPVPGEVLEMRFVSPSLALLRYNDGYVLLPVTVSTSSPATISYGSPTPLPTRIHAQLESGDVDTDVLQWACTP